MFQHITTITDHLLFVCPEQLHIIKTVVLIQDCGHTDTNWSAGHYIEIWLIPCPHTHTHTHTHTHHSHVCTLTLLLLLDPAQLMAVTLTV